MDLFDYVDYRSYLRDFYTEQKRKNPSYSFRVFATKAKLGSPNYLKLVMDRSRRITDKNLPQFVRGLKLPKPEAEYFKYLVLYEECEDLESKKSYLDEALRIKLKCRRSAQEVGRSRYAIFSSWRHWVIREMVLLRDFKPDPAWIAHKLGGKVTAKQAEESLKLLTELEFVRKVEGRYRLNEPLLGTGDEHSSLLLRELHRQFIELGVRSIFRDPLEAREISGLTIALPRSKVPEIKRMIKEFRKELNRLFSQDQGNDDVYHLVINLFPLTHEEKGKSA